MSGRHDLWAAEHGFTLLELLVAMTLLGLLMAAMFDGLRLGARVWQTAEARLDASARTQIVQDFIRQHLAGTLPLEAVPPDHPDVGVAEPLFLGTVEAVRFASLLPENPGSGVYLMELTLAPHDHAEGPANLMLRWRPLEPTGQRGERLEQHERVLMEKIEALELSYFGTSDPKQPPDWWQTWEGQLELPRLIRLQVYFAENDERRWPELIVRPMIDRVVGFQF